jgi:hypothetical protein
MNYVLFFVLAAGISSGCSTLSRGFAGAGQAMRIEVKGSPGTSTETRYYSNSNVKTFSDGQLLRDKQEIVDFTTVTQIKAFDPLEKVLTFSVRTTEKDGTVQLNDLAFPEKFEVIDYMVRTDGSVLKAGKHPPQSLFFVPSLPVPKEEVRVGDTWVMEHTWFSSREGIPLRLEVVGILKGIIPCAGKYCADIEVSGGVKLVKVATAESARFESRVWGRLLYSPDRGDIIWSEMRSQEEMAVDSDKFTVLSCMVSESKISAKYKTKLECAPAVAPVDVVPTNL